MQEMNNNNTTFISAIQNDDDDIPEDSEFNLITKIIIGVVLMCLIIGSIAGNALVVAAIFTERTLRKVGNLFLASLAIADISVALLVMTFAGLNDLMGFWVFGPYFCDTWIAFDVMCSTASILNLCAIALDRYVHIKDPLGYGRWVNKISVCSVISVVWFLAALVSFMPIFLDLHRPAIEAPVENNTMPTCALDLSPTYAVVSSCISFVLPCAIMLGIYCRLYVYAQRHVKNIRAMTRTSGRTTTPLHVSDHKAAVTVGVIMGVFLICWVPFFCVNIIAAFCKTCIPGIVFKLLTWLGYSNSLFNPIIYSIYNTEFREAFKRILTNHCCTCERYEIVSAADHTNLERGRALNESRNIHQFSLHNDNPSPRRNRFNSMDSSEKTVDI